MHAPSSTRLIQPQDCDASASISDEQLVIMLHMNIFAKRLSTQFTTACRPSWLASSLPDAVAFSLARRIRLRRSSLRLAAGWSTGDHTFIIDFIRMASSVAAFLAGLAASQWMQMIPTRAVTSI